MKALRIVRANMQREVDEFMIFCYFAPCTCDESNEGMLCTRCDEIRGYEKDIETQLIANSIACLCVQASECTSRQP